MTDSKRLADTLNLAVGDKLLPELLRIVFEDAHARLQWSQTLRSPNVRLEMSKDNKKGTTTIALFPLHGGHQDPYHWGYWDRVLSDLPLGALGPSRVEWGVRLDSLGDYALSFSVISVACGVALPSVSMDPTENALTDRHGIYGGGMSYGSALSEEERGAFTLLDWHVADLESGVLTSQSLAYKSGCPIRRCGSMTCPPNPNLAQYHIFACGRLGSQITLVDKKPFS